tara:strand:- start:644 stop:1045 length:402 start_codon:yes stop_codon:yes gene_type:complete
MSDSKPSKPSKKTKVKNPYSKLNQKQMMKNISSIKNDITDLKKKISDVEKRNVNQGKNQAAMYNQITDLKKDIQKLRKELEASKLQSFRDIDRLNENIARNKNSQLEKLRLIVDQIKLLGATTGVNIDRRVRF